MDFEYDSRKSEANKAKHRIDFEEAKAFWRDENAVTIRVLVEPEVRFARIAKLGSQAWTTIFTVREDNVRIISSRRARRGEVKLYEERQSKDN
jgi:uncharacterized DUF497 family protein